MFLLNDNIGQKRTTGCRIVKGKLHSRIIISDIVGFFSWVLWWRFKVKICTGTRSNRQSKMVKISRVTTARPVLNHWCQPQEFEAAEWSWIWPGLRGLLRQVAYELVPADHERFELLAWSTMIARWHHCHHKSSHVPYFLPSVWPTSSLNFNVGPSPSDSTETIYQIRANGFGVQFSFNFEND